MKYSEFIEQHKRSFWKSAEGKVVGSKRLAKALASSMGIPVPKTYDLPANSFFKPDRLWGGQKCQSIIDPADWILEERIEHKYDYRAFVIAGQVRMIQVDTAEQGEGKFIITGQSYYRWPDWVRLNADKDLNTGSVKELEIETPPAQIDQIVSYAEKFGPMFALPIRVDFMTDVSGRVVFNELCATPGFIVNRRVTDEVDEWLGSFITQSDAESPAAPAS